MEGRVQIRCAECGKTRDCSGEIPGEYTSCFATLVRDDGFVPRPGVDMAFICGACLRREFEGHESVDDKEKVRGAKK